MRGNPSLVNIGKQLQAHIVHPVFQGVAQGITMKDRTLTLKKKCFSVVSKADENNKEDGSILNVPLQRCGRSRNTHAMSRYSHHVTILTPCHDTHTMSRYSDDVAVLSYTKLRNYVTQYILRLLFVVLLLVRLFIKEERPRCY